MSEREDLDTDLTSYSLDDEDQLQPGDSLMGTGAGDEDPLDAGYSPPDSARGSYAHGVTAAEQQVGETIDQRVKQEEPDTRWGDPDEPGRRGDDRVGGDDPDSIAAEDDWIGDQEVGDARAGRLVSPDEGSHADVDDQAWGRDVGVDGGAASAEEAAMHVIDGRAEEEED
ncbi:DUF5709 domain-containing protein [Janibacter indicus]|uniref:DUF5709 domain-containing protein n=1 Tax=Janibacter indicus TaxID=857417 RepID=A0A1W1Z791_9MICO|nr:DUF5709 domain-containing protein [Janibacter indicus]SMC44001.1 hypothetical protein SAMN06296429_103126 [Janibacter indicus]